MKAIVKGLLLLIAAIGVSGYSANAQYVASLDGDKVTIRDIRGSYVASRYFNDVADVVCGTEIVVLQYKGKIEVRTNDLDYIASRIIDDINGISAAGDFVVLYYVDGKVEVRDSKLNYVSSWRR